MLQGIFIASEASYSASGQHLAPCKEINFIFGTNGSGKTTISRILANPTSYPTCNVKWSNDRELERLVYNSDFIARNFNSTMRGIFTLGEESKETLAKIETLKEQQGRLQTNINSLQIQLSGEDGKGGKIAELHTLRGNFEGSCWTGIKGKHDAYFSNAFEGLRNSKVKFCDKILEELAKNNSKICTLEDLQERAKTVFKDGLTKESPIALPSVDNLLALVAPSILAKKVIGKEDVDVAALIKRLGNSDWVKQGRTYLDQSGKQCPFCQQELLADVAKNLDEYFDESYIADTAAIDSLQTAYTTYADAVIKRLEEILSLNSAFLDNETLRTEIDLLTQRIELNKQHIAQKKKEPSTVVTLESLVAAIAAITNRLIAANDQIKKHNDLVDNLTTAKKTLIAEIWKYLLEESEDMIGAYAKAKSDLDKAVAGLQNGITKKQSELADANGEIIALERSITSVQPTVNEINGILSSFGFTNFSLVTAGETNHLYKIVRADGSDADKTLSEGEKSFITFLYFYHLIKGSNSESGMTTDRIVVFDDPVSSLDSDILFIVSTLIKRVLEEACLGTGQIKQVFVLTHNIYFHKEVSFDPNRKAECRKHETFWIVRKLDNESVLTEYKYNPIKTSYELLWSEVSNPNRSKMTIQNTLRRIIENYFKILGNVDTKEIAEKFEGKDRQICGSLFSWVHDGSHAVHDDLYISADDSIVERYLDVFRRIFEVTNHMGHYNMMMKIDPASESPSPVVQLAAA